MNIRDTKEGYTQIVITRAMTEAIINLLGLEGLQPAQVIGSIASYAFDVGQKRENVLRLFTETVNQVFDQREKVEAGGACGNPGCKECKGKDREVN